VREFGRRVRASPALSVGPDLDRLIEQADREDEGYVAAYKSPIANLTWMQRGTLSRVELASPQLPMEIPFACKIVACKVVTILNEMPGDGVDFVEPPLSAIDVVMQLNRKELFTARVDKLNAANQDTMVVSLASFDDAVRTFELTLNPDDNILSVQFKWAVDLAIVAAYEWGNVQISMNWAVDPKIRYGELASKRFGP
jgi:hypothetical protein